jgi:hypothetical protein
MFRVANTKILNLKVSIYKVQVIFMAKKKKISSKCAVNSRKIKNIQFLNRN